MTDKRKFITCDGNYAAAHVSYAFTETAGIYPITPSSDMAEHTDNWASAGKKNIFGETVRVVEMQSEAGAAGFVHGSLQAGALTTTFTASQGLLLMIPNMYKIAGELLPSVFYVSARAIASHALSIFGDHSDVYATRMTGFAMLCCSSVQEVMDLSPVAHLATLKSRVPFTNFFDGFRTSHEIQKIQAWDYADLAKLVDQKALQDFRDRSLNPEHPVTRGIAQNPDVFFQAREACNPYYNAVPGIVEEYMNEINKLTGRNYQLFNYYGAPDAEHVIVAMGSGTEAMRETVDYLVKKGEKVGLIVVHLYRPFSAKHFIGALPKTAKRVTVLDRTKEPGASGEPLYLDVKNVLSSQANAPLVVGGRFGIASKDTTPRSIIAVYDNMKQPEPKNGFTVGIVDDVTFLSLPEPKGEINIMPADVVECKFYGLGSDGTVGANKNSIKIIGDHTSMYAQGYFAYDSKKSGGITTSHLRFGKDPITATYLVSQPNFVSCSEMSYVNKYDMLKGIKKGGTFLLNSIWSKEKIVKHLPNFFKRQLAQNNVKFYILNATKIAEELGLGSRTNTIMQAAFFFLSQVIPYEDAVKYMKDAVKKSYAKKGEEVINMNCAAIDRGKGDLVEVAVDPAWASLSGDLTINAGGVDETTPLALSNFVTKIAAPVNQLEGDALPVSAFVDYVDGTMPAGSSQYEKRGIAVHVPEWQADNCIQCNQCAYVCPHAVIRPFLLNEKEMAGAPAGLQTLKPVGKAYEGLAYRIQVSVLDCTGCGSCANVCPATKGKALVMKSLESQLDNGKNWDYISKNVTYKDNLAPKNNVKNSQFAQSLFEFSGACAGCGETPYVKLITQLYGERLAVANATGCSSIYGGSFPATSYRTNAEGRGPAWGNSLFEDNAEFGMGINVAYDKLRDRVRNLVAANVANVSGDLKALFEELLANFNDGDKTSEIAKKLVPALEKDGSALAKELLSMKRHFVKKSMWVFGGDGWAYDIGFGGLDHVLASGENINVLVLDTEVYSNTGGQASKSSPAASVAKFASSGKPIRKKDLGRIAMTYGYVYVAQVAMGANQAQFLKAVQEAEAYPGPSLIIAYAPCIAHGIKKLGMTASQTIEKNAVECGYWQLYRYNPQLEAEGKNAFVLDSKEPDFSKFQAYLQNEVRYASLTGIAPDNASNLYKMCEDDAKWRYNQYKRLAE